MPTIAKQIGQMVKEEVRKEFGKQRSPSPANIGRNRRNSARREMWITNPVENPPVFVARKSSVPYVPPTPRREDTDDHIPSEFKAKTTSNLVISGVAGEDDNSSESSQSKLWVFTKKRSSICFIYTTLDLFVFFTGSGDGNLVKTTIKAIQLKANPEAIEEGNTEVLDMIDDLFDNFFDNCKEDMDEDDVSDDSDNDENPDENLDENPDEDSDENPDEDSDENPDENPNEDSDENPDENPDEDINIELIQDEGHEDGKDEKIDDIEVKLMIKGIIGDLIPSVIKENIVEKVNVEVENEKKSDEEILEQSRLEKEFLEKRQKQNEERLELEKKERKWSEREKLRQEKNITICAIKENSPKKAQQETEIDKNPDKTDDHTIPNNTEATNVSCVFTEKYFCQRALYY